MKLGIHLSNLAAEADSRDAQIFLDILLRGHFDVHIDRNAASSSEDYALIFPCDVHWHLTEGDCPPSRWIVLRPARDTLTDLAEEYKVAALLYYVDPHELETSGSGLVVRRDVANRLGGKIGLRLPYIAKQSEHYGGWIDYPFSSPVEALRAYLESPIPPQSPKLIEPEVAREHRLAPQTIHVDERAAGMTARLFPFKNIYLALNGPPGAPISLVVWDCTFVAGGAEAAVSALFVTPWARGLMLISQDAAYALGELQQGVTFSTGEDRARVASFGFRVATHTGSVLITCGVSGASSTPFSARDVMMNRMISTVVSTLQIDGVIARQPRLF
jgi:hypothetical protein